MGTPFAFSRSAFVQDQREHCISMESENPKIGTVVIDILGREE